MLQKASTKCRMFKNAAFKYADITHLEYPDNSFDIVVAGNVIHLLDEPLKALAELNRVCRPNGKMIIPTYMNREKRKGNVDGLVNIIGKAGADFKRQFTFSSYRQFFIDAGFKDVKITMADGCVPCAIVVIEK